MFTLSATNTRRPSEPNPQSLGTSVNASSSSSSSSSRNTAPACSLCNTVSLHKMTLLQHIAEAHSDHVQLTRGHFTCKLCGVTLLQKQIAHHLRKDHATLLSRALPSEPPLRRVSRHSTPLMKSATRNSVPETRSPYRSVSQSTHRPSPGKTARMRPAPPKEPALFKDNRKPATEDVHVHATLAKNGAAPSRKHVRRPASGDGHAKVSDHQRNEVGFTYPGSVKEDLLDPVRIQDKDKAVRPRKNDAPSQIARRPKTTSCVREKRLTGEKNEAATPINKPKQGKPTCPVCHQTFSRTYSVRLHVRRRHASADSPQYTWQCEVCDLAFHALRLLTGHQHIHHPCPCCDRLAFPYTMPGDPVIQDQAHASPSCKDFLAFPCRFCDREYATRRGLTMHLNHHHPESRMQCLFCPEKFDTRFYRDEHMQNVHGHSPLFQCYFCDQVFFDARSVLRHKRETHPRIKANA